MGKVKLELEDDEDTPGPSSSQNGGGGGLTINKAYAERYDNWRRLEELQKMKDKYGDDFEDHEYEESSSSEEEPEWTADDEKDFLRTLSALKGGDERLYDKETLFWHEKQQPEGAVDKAGKKEKEKKPKAMTLKDYERELVLRGGDIDDEVKAEPGEMDEGYYSQQERLKQELKAAMNGVDEEEDDLLVKRVKTEEEEKREEDEYYEWLAGRDERTIQGASDLKALRKAWTSSKIDEDEKFLRDYLLNKQYDTDGRVGDRIPTYDEIVGLKEEEEEDAKAREFERKYNFRFEDPDQEFIKQYPRTVGESLRQAKSKRSEKREDVKERKAREKKEKAEEIKQMKKMKKAEIEKKFEKLRKMAGDGVPISLEDLEGDFDPKEYDKRMEELFNQEYYSKEVDEEEKPVFSDSESEGSNYDEMEIGGRRNTEDEDEGLKAPKKKSRKKGAVEEDGDEESGEEQEQEDEEPLFREKEASRRKRKRNSKFVEAVKRSKPLFDPKEKTFEEYFDEYYSLDYEDIIGDQRTRFKYRTVVPNNFGLSVDEILEADDRNLNAWASLKKAVAYRSEKEESHDVQAYSRKASDLDKKKRILNTDFGGKRSQKQREEEARLKGEKAAEKEKKKLEEKKEEEGKEKDAEEGEKKKRKKKKNKKKKGDAGAAEEKTPQSNQNGASNGESTAAKKKRSRKRKFVDSIDVGVADDRLKAYGINPKKFKSKIAYGSKKNDKEE